MAFISYAYPAVTSALRPEKPQFGGHRSFSKEFSQAFHRLNKSPEELISLCQQPAHFINSGANSEVYAIPGVPGFVLKVNKEKQAETISPFTEDGPDFEGQNLGQVIGNFGPNYLILVKQQGEEHSLPAWSDLIMTPEEIEQQHAVQVKEQIARVVNLTPEAYINYASTIKLLSQKGYKTDPFNPNNLLITADAINPIDYFRIPSGQEQKFRSTVYDMFYPLLDVSLFSHYHSLLTEPSQGKIIEAAKTIIQRCYESARSVGLSINTTDFDGFLDHTDKYFGNYLPEKNYRDRLEDTVKLLGIKLP